MTAKIIQFPKSQKQLELEAMQQFVEKAKVTIAASIEEDLKRYNTPNIKGIPVEEPKTRFDYLEICKDFLDPDDYQDILCGIMDKEHYDALEKPLRNVIDSYFSFKE
jgi:hypothetical protein